MSLPLPNAMESHGAQMLLLLADAAACSDQPTPAPTPTRLPSIRTLAFTQNFEFDLEVTQVDANEQPLLSNSPRLRKLPPILAPPSPPPHCVHPAPAAIASPTTHPLSVTEIMENPSLKTVSPPALQSDFNSHTLSHHEIAPCAHLSHPTSLTTPSYKQPPYPMLPSPPRTLISAPMSLADIVDTTDTTDDTSTDPDADMNIRRISQSTGNNHASTHHPSPTLSVSDIDTDLTRVSPTPGTIFKCPQCPKVFTRKYNLQSHMRCHIIDRPFACQHCQATFVRKHDLQRHTRSLHSAFRPHVCPNCGVSFARSDGLKRHLETESRLCVSSTHAVSTDAQSLSCQHSRTRSISSSSSMSSSSSSSSKPKRRLRKMPSHTLHDTC